MDRQASRHKWINRLAKQPVNQLIHPCIFRHGGLPVRQFLHLYNEGAENVEDSFHHSVDLHVHHLNLQQQQDPSVSEAMEGMPQTVKIKLKHLLWLEGPTQMWQ